MPLEIEEHVDDRPLPIAMPLSKYWAMDDGYFFTSLDAILSMSAADASAMAEHGRLRMESDAAEYSRTDKKPYRVKDGVAYLDMVGPMTKRPNCMAEMFGGGGVSTLRMRQTLRAAVNDADVKSIMLVIESPGGEVNGAFDLAGDVAKANKIKPVAAYIEDLGASAAYLVASQAGKIYANSNAISGSIGVYQEIHDTSEAASKRGVKVHVIKAGEHKGIGVPGTEVTDSQLAVVQANANKLHGLFLRAVSRGRGMDAKALARVADGGVFIGADGKRAGLVDNIITLDEAHSEVKSTRRRGPKGKTTMAADETEVQRMLDQAASDETVVLDEDTTPEPTTAVVATPAPVASAQTTISTEMIGALAAANITTPDQLNGILEMSKVGEDYAAALRKQVTQLAVVAFGQADGPAMSAGIETATVPQLKAFSRQFSGIAQAKGLMAANGERSGRETVAQEIAGGVQGANNGQPTSESNEGKVKVPASEPVAQNRANMNGTGLYAL